MGQNYPFKCRYLRVHPFPLSCLEANLRRFFMVWRGIIIWRLMCRVLGRWFGRREYMMCKCCHSIKAQWNQLLWQGGAWTSGGIIAVLWVIKRCKMRGMGPFCMNESSWNVRYNLPRRLRCFSYANIHFVSFEVRFSCPACGFWLI